MTYSPWITPRGAEPIPVDPAQLLATGAMTGPHRPTHPVTLTLRVRAVRALRKALSHFTTRSPL